MIARIDVWYSKEFDCWLVSKYDDEDNQLGGAVDFYSKSEAVEYARLLMPVLNISKRSEATI